ncbi:hypothetical protein E5F05_02145 (plasmid) [Deinococcus metallilatus]|uniref:Uncharacterized protein n=1 Tax=Deinococcus metallilatus TaxID=1211322 RepID=A0ABR6MV31_9DEIO|nr:hypothetical protein [Deinococcus metallilatus]MBB5295799.1 hypothetical protein [Deinococcus metallilatus]QBY06768.1 hypothetical protein E5F05_02145 [Deinococcus metallilatus]GMA14327.1 hypothetical protein GCM10025871_06580 [Deinococcus metallilatus]
MTGLPVLVKHVRCQASGHPDTLADVSLIQQGGQYRIGRVTYNEGARAVLDQGQTFPITRRAYERYVLGGESFTEFGMNALLGLWRVLGMSFRLDDAEYHCTVS